MFQRLIKMPQHCSLSKGAFILSFYSLWISQINDLFFTDCWFFGIHSLCQEEQGTHSNSAWWLYLQFWRLLCRWSSAARILVALCLLFRYTEHSWHTPWGLGPQVSWLPSTGGNLHLPIVLDLGAQLSLVGSICDTEVHSYLESATEFTSYL